MSQLFPRYADPLLRMGFLATGLLALGGPALLLAWERTPYVTQEADPLEQPVEFDHRHHVRDDGIDCTYCHDGAARDEFAGMPTAAKCMRCHTQVWNRSDELAIVRGSAESGKPIAWRRVTNLPQHVFFHHGIHTSKGVACVECHGRVDRMAAVEAAQRMSMSFCLECHFDPAPHLRSPDKVTDMDYVPAEGEGERVRREQSVVPDTSCSACHR